MVLKATILPALYDATVYTWSKGTNANPPIDIAPIPSLIGPHQQIVQII